MSEKTKGIFGNSNLILISHYGEKEGCLIVKREECCRIRLLSGANALDGFVYC